MCDVKDKVAKRIHERFWSNIDFRLGQRFSSRQLRWVVAHSTDIHYDIELLKTRTRQRHYLVDKDTEEKLAIREINLVFADARWCETVVFRYNGHKNPFSPLNPLEYALAFVRILF